MKDPYLKQLETETKLERYLETIADEKEREIRRKMLLKKDLKEKKLELKEMALNISEITKQVLELPYVVIDDDRYTTVAQEYVIKGLMKPLQEGNASVETLIQLKKLTEDEKDEKGITLNIVTNQDLGN